MGQFGFFDADRRLAAITAKGDPLEMIARVVPFESFRAEIEAAVLTPVSEKKSPAGRKPIDVMVLQSLYNLSDEQVAYQVRDRLSFTRFLGLGIEDGIPDGTTLWLFRESSERYALSAYTSEDVLAWFKSPSNFRLSCTLASVTSYCRISLCLASAFTWFL